MKIIHDTYCPDSTYFTSSDVAPIASATTCRIFNGHGTRHSWGKPEVTSTVIVNTATFTAVHVGFHHKHRGGQQWYFFVNGERKTWSQLSDKRRTQVLADMKKAPSWAKVPGVLKAQRKAPETRTAYKLVKVSGDKMLSLYDGETEYQIGKRLAEKAASEHRGGYYAYPTAEGCIALWNAGKLVPASRYTDVEQVALLEVEISGTIVEYGTKLAATYIKPIRVLEVINV